MKKFIIKTLGCKTNQVESALIAEILTSNNYIETNSIEDANYYILNSCSVTHIADTKNLSYLRRARRENPNLKIVVTGCMAQLEKENLLKDNIADFVIGNNEKADIVKIIEKEENICVSDIFSHDNFRYEKLHQTHRTRASVKIQDGCNNRCSYCTIPYARGKNRSNSIENVIEQVNLFADEGYFETVLTGIHIGQWGEDFKPQLKLQNLLEEIENSKIKRYRLGSLNPLELTPEFIDFLSKSEKFCPHFHLSLQSVCDKTLKAMNRKYSAEQIKDLVKYINTKFTNAFIGNDIIVGFPNETEEDFDVTYNNLKELELTRIHVFPYSRRKGTPADKMTGQISQEEKKRRVTLVQELSDEKIENFFKQNIGTENEVIIEKVRDKKSGFLKGVTKNYINVLIDAADTYKDKLVKVKLTSLSEYNEKMIAEIST
ncbi:MAG: tRNA (N(6)-L-threonylcarbamoyladenosine(37)-C(2))-methylthiotransferase MtaB [Candidatus Gastranaerophilales bacterium]|nr:tRNA (N(6)-L-threonylcarbamoyladenosine(37)-C(2))-methylthiotransferase MtaB [Candidatus Gastranaerophilales bacterium]